MITVLVLLVILRGLFYFMNLQVGLYRFPRAALVAHRIILRSILLHHGVQSKSMVVDCTQELIFHSSTDLFFGP